MGWGVQIFDVEFCWITNFGVTELFVVIDEFVVINGGTNVTRFFDKNDDDDVVDVDVVGLELFCSWFVVKSFVDDINVWIFGDVVPGGISVTNGDEFVPVEWLGDELRM